MIFVLFFISISLSAFGSGYGQSVTTDDIKGLRRELFLTRGYDKYARPIPKRDVLQVQLHYSLIHVKDLCLKTQTITTEGWLWYQWHDESLRWDDTKVSAWHNIKSLRVPSPEIFRPDIMAYNGIDYTTPKMADTNAIIYPTGLIIWVPPITTQALCKINLKHWPYDEHICFLKFGSWTHDGLIMDVKSLNSTNKTVISDLWPNSEFDIKFLNVTNNVTYYDCCKEPYPSVIFFFKLQRKPTLYHYIISVPALVAVVSTLIAFWFPIRDKTRFVLNGFSLLTLTLLLLHLGSELGFASLGVPASVRFLSLTALFIGILQIWFTIGFNTSQLKCAIPVWTMKLTKPVLHLYRSGEHESIHLTQTDQSPDVSKDAPKPTAEDLTFIVDKIVFVVFGLAMAISIIATHN